VIRQVTTTQLLTLATMPTEGVHIMPNGKKRFIPLENNPEVFTSLVHDLGVSPKLGFYDVYSIDEPSLIAMVPRPVHALIFITPGPMYFAVRKEEGTRLLDDQEITYDGAGDTEPIVWFRQTIGHACGLMALVHAIANGEARSHVHEGSLIDRLIKEALPLRPAERADVLYNSEELEVAHMKAARTGDTVAPQAADDNGYHFIAFTKGKDGHLWELEGASDGPVDLGLLPEGVDMLSDVALDSGVRRYLKHANGNVEFSIVALAEQAE
jgi:ubiquitin carboxyl-terminal hydrolase L3